MTKFNKTFRIETTRLKEWDYSNPWWYYVTINTKDHQEYFGKVENEKMILNELGKIADRNWGEIPLHFINIEIDYYIVMPNHIHGILIINPIGQTKDSDLVKSRDVACKVFTKEEVETCHGKSLQENERIFSKPIKNSLSVIVNQFKGSVTRWAIRNGYNDFSWQSRFYDRIIRNEKELYNTRKYIKENPLKWELEKNAPENIFD